MEYKKFIRKPTAIQALQIKTGEDLNTIKERMKQNGIDIEVTLNDWLVINEFGDTSFLPDYVFKQMFTEESK